MSSRFRTPHSLIISILSLFFFAPHLSIAQTDTPAAERTKMIETFAAGDEKTAKDWFARYLEQHPEDHEIRGYLGHIEHHTGNLQTAEENYRKALAIEPSSILWQLSLSEILLEKGKYQEALPLLKKILSHSPGHLYATRLLRDALMHLGMTADASLLNEELLKHLGSGPESWSEEQFKAHVFLSDGKTLKAKNQLEKLVKLHPELFSAKVDLCGIYFSLGVYRKCRPLILGVEPPEVEDLEFAVLRAAYHMKETEFQEADRWIQRALDLSPSRHDLISLKYVNDFQLGKIVLDEVRKPEEGKKVSLEEHYRKASLLLASGSIGAAQKKIRWLMHFYPDDPHLKLMDAYCETAYGHYDVAIKALEALSQAKLQQISVVDDIQEMLKEAVRAKQFEDRVRSVEWPFAEKVKTKYFNITMNVASPYRESILKESDENLVKIHKLLVPLFGRKGPEKTRVTLKIYADKRSFNQEARDYMFADAVFFAGVYTKERRAIYYHFTEDLKTSGLVHEMAHFLVDEMMANAPLWLHEGLAEYASMKLGQPDFAERKMIGNIYLRQLFRFENLPALDVLVKKRDYSMESYILWRGAAQFFFEFENGKYLAPLRDYMDLLSNETFVTDPFREAFSWQLEQMEADWKTFAERTWTVA